VNESGRALGTGLYTVSSSGYIVEGNIPMRFVFPETPVYCVLRDGKAV
jgi:hypothetical protein